MTIPSASGRPAPSPGSRLTWGGFRPRRSLCDGWRGHPFCGRVPYWDAVDAHVKTWCGNLNQLLNMAIMGKNRAGNVQVLDTPMRFGRVFGASDGAIWPFFGEPSNRLKREVQGT